MTEVSPFRERPSFLMCPRCGEMLDRAFEATLACPRCEGVWIAPATIEKAFGNPKWPVAQAMWWRNSIECPQCATEGTATMMDAAIAGNVIIDRCSKHGMWLDRGELGRLMGGATDNDQGDDDLEALRQKLSAVELDLDAMIKRRETWRSDLELRRKAAIEYRSWLEAEERRRIEAAKARTQRERERIEAERMRAEAEGERLRMVQRLGDARVQASAEVARFETQIIMLREQLRTNEAELEGARGRLRAIDDQLAAHER
jgi:Zn-finger nucleic acid-binding protein